MIYQIIGAFFASAAFSVIFHIRGKDIFYAGLNGGLGYLVYLFAIYMGGYPALFLSSAAMSLYAEVMARVRKVPATLFIVAGLIPIVPGGGMYNCMLTALNGNLTESAYLCYNTLLEAGAIAVGIIAVSSLVKLVPRKSGSH